MHYAINEHLRLAQHSDRPCPNFQMNRRLLWYYLSALTRSIREANKACVGIVHPPPTPRNSFTSRRHENIFCVWWPMWRNWQTRRTQNPVAFKAVWVRPPPSVPSQSEGRLISASISWRICEKSFPIMTPVKTGRRSRTPLINQNNRHGFLNRRHGVAISRGARPNWDNFTTPPQKRTEQAAFQGIIDILWQAAHGSQRGKIIQPRHHHTAHTPGLIHKWAPAGVARLHRHADLVFIRIIFDARQTADFAIGIFRLGALQINIRKPDGENRIAQFNLVRRDSKRGKMSRDFQEGRDRRFHPGARLRPGIPHPPF